MSDTQVPMSRDPATPATPATPAPRRGGAWSKEDTFKLLEELLDAPRNREFLGLMDRTGDR
ncbi:hypothetical protein E4U09_000583 [Claviceps aff. purpurea]|uniref:Uncharacterized protein n=1 Tax=Claviceps aff. purpurea TaxID=1967640 RepID=A0A9P7QIU0_9HYPO|nr:hypothetical protein E4U09_000583 [Claviceps aff. purpurea]